ncbi:glycosyltransferase family 2 protein [Flavobacterium sp.]|uniref:glycosyltransferase family 2 protein n=1 Tax=Flavobacterium sp. TaxID=239 RepID=UPI003D0FF7AC
MIPKVSVIVPVYNTEKYVERALISLMEQTLSDVEFIIIDDGSTDKSAEIISNVITRYPNFFEKILFVKRENRGVASTRAEGIDMARGEYIIHCDSDDYCNKDMLLQMYSVAKEKDLDILVTDFILDFGSTKILQSQKNVIGNNCVSLLLRGDLDVSLSNKLIKKALYTENDVRVINGFNMGEDFCTILRLVYFAKKIDYLEIVSFYYNKYNNSSATSHYTKKSLNDIVQVVLYVENFLREKKIYNKYAKDFLEYKIIVKNLHLWNGLQNPYIYDKGINLFPEVNSTALFNSNKISFFLKFILIFGKKIKTRKLFLFKEEVRIFISTKETN